MCPPLSFEGHQKIGFKRSRVETVEGTSTDLTYSARSATDGCTAVARRAGTTLAATATSARRPVTTAHRRGSVTASAAISRKAARVTTRRRDFTLRVPSMHFRQPCQKQP